jgi:hypothetical protein
MPMAMPIIESALLVLFLNGFFSINVMNLILTTPLCLTVYYLNLIMNQTYNFIYFDKKNMSRYILKVTHIKKFA